MVIYVIAPREKSDEAHRKAADIAEKEGERVVIVWLNEYDISRLVANGKAEGLLRAIEEARAKKEVVVYRP